MVFRRHRCIHGINCLPFTPASIYLAVPRLRQEEPRPHGTRHERVAVNTTTAGSTRSSCSMHSAIPSPPPNTSIAHRTVRLRAGTPTPSCIIGSIPLSGWDQRCLRDCRPPFLQRLSQRREADLRRVQFPGDTTAGALLGWQHAAACFESLDSHTRQVAQAMIDEVTTLNEWANGVFRSAAATGTVGRRSPSPKVSSRITPRPREEVRGPQVVGRPVAESKLPDDREMVYHTRTVPRQIVRLQEQATLRVAR